jgi:hypothetical protein
MKHLRQLLHLAASQGLTVHGAHLEEDTLGLYSPDERRIYFDLKLTPFERRSILAHELGHAHYGHDCDSPRNERQADIFAARLLIDPAEYAQLERFNPDPHFLADELHVTVDLIHTFEAHCLTRLRGVTYARAKMGLGRWEFRAAPEWAPA